MMLFSNLILKLFSPHATDALKEVAEIAAQLQSSLIRLENFQKLTELQRDLIGIENLTGPGRVSGRSRLVKLEKELRGTNSFPLSSGVHTRRLPVQAD